MFEAKRIGRLSASVLAVALSIPLTSGLAEARSHHSAAKPAKPSGKSEAVVPMLVGTFGDWSAYRTQGGKAKVCYALAQPKDRSPSSLKKVAAHIFISNRPAENVKNEISMIMGVPLKESADAKAEVGSTSFDLVAKGQNVFVKNAADEGRFIDALKKSGKLTVKATLAKGGQVSDSYALGGLSQALDRIVKECQ